MVLNFMFAHQIMTPVIHALLYKNLNWETYMTVACVYINRFDNSQEKVFS